MEEHGRAWTSQLSTGPALSSGLKKAVRLLNLRSLIQFQQIELACEIIGIWNT